MERSSLGMLQCYTINKVLLPVGVFRSDHQLMWLATCDVRLRFSKSWFLFSCGGLFLCVSRCVVDPLCFVPDEIRLLWTINPFSCQALRWLLPSCPLHARIHYMQYGNTVPLTCMLCVLGTWCHRIRPNAQIALGMTPAADHVDHLTHTHTDRL